MREIQAVVLQEIKEGGGGLFKKDLGQFVRLSGRWVGGWVEENEAVRMSYCIPTHPPNLPP